MTIVIQGTFCYYLVNQANYFFFWKASKLHHINSSYSLADIANKVCNGDKQEMTYVLAAQKKTPRKSPGFYTPAQAARIALVPIWTLNSWKRKGIIIPSIEWTDELNTKHIGHTFETVVFMRLIRLLRSKEISLHNSVKAVQQLNQRYGTPGERWFDAKVFVDKDDVYTYSDKDTWDTTALTKYNQRIAEVVLGEEFLRLKERADSLLIPSQYLEFVEIDTSIQNGLPIIKDTKILTSLVHKLSAQDYRPDEIQKMYPFLQIDKIIGAEEYEVFLDKANLN